MNRKYPSVLVIIILASILLSACASNSKATQPSGDVTAPTLPAGSVQINGAGATFPLPVYTEWIFAYQYVDPSVTINYQGIGSGGGKKAIVDNTVDFAGSDSLLVDDEYTAGKDLQMYPMVAGAMPWQRSAAIGIQT
jgi:phosphate transport system substrate-binding protein